jgi:hypothetical protein
MKLAMEEKKAIAKAERKAKKAEKKANGIENGSTKRKVKDNTELPPAKKINLAPSSATAAVVNKVKEELEARNKQQKSSAIQSIYRKKGEEKKQTYLSAGTFNRY